MELGPDGGRGEVRFYRPDGRPLCQAPALPKLAGEPVTALVSRLASQEVIVDARETLPSWEGGPVDYAWAIDSLRWRDRQDRASIAG